MAGFFTIFHGLFASVLLLDSPHPRSEAYRGIDPAVVPGTQIQDAGAVDFASTAGIDSAAWRYRKGEVTASWVRWPPLIWVICN